MIQFSLGVKLTEGVEYRDSETCDNCGERTDLLEVRRYSFGEHCQERKVCLPCESLKNKQP